MNILLHQGAEFLNGGVARPRPEIKRLHPAPAPVKRHGPGARPLAVRFLRSPNVLLKVKPLHPPAGTARTETADAKAKALLICPDRREAVGALAENAPLACVSILGRSLVECWLVHLAGHGVKEVLILAADRPGQVRALVGNGERWGLRVEVLPETRELTPDEARVKFQPDGNTGPLPTKHDPRLMDHLPGLPEFPLFTSYADWVAAVQAWMPRAMTPDRIGIREIKPGVWASLTARVSDRAELHAPCWVGEHVRVAAGAVVGPGAVLENRVIVEGGAEIAGSVVGPETLVGQLAAVRHSIALGGTLVNWRLNSMIKVSEAFLLCSLCRSNSEFGRAGVLSRITAALVMVLTLPLAGWAALKAILRRWPVLSTRLAVRPGLSAGAAPLPRETFVYQELIGAGRWSRRWPQLWRIVRGDFAWIGNRPLSRDQAGSLSNDFERLWLAAPIGLFSLADAEGCGAEFNDEARAHSSYYAAEANRRLDATIFLRLLFLLIVGIPCSQARKRWTRAARPAGDELQIAH